LSGSDSFPDNQVWSQEWEMQCSELDIISLKKMQREIPRRIYQ
jgi:hypothetical protein